MERLFREQNSNYGVMIARNMVHRALRTAVYVCMWFADGAWVIGSTDEISTGASECLSQSIKRMHGMMDGMEMSVRVFGSGGLLLGLVLDSTHRCGQG